MKRILICGDDHALLDVRAQVLRLSSFDVDVVQGLKALRSMSTNSTPDLIILCTSMSLNDRETAKTIIEQRLPAVSLLTLLRGGESAFGGGNFMRSFDGPDKLIQESRELTRD